MKVAVLAVPKVKVQVLPGTSLPVTVPARRPLLVVPPVKTVPLRAEKIRARVLLVRKLPAVATRMAVRVPMVVDRKLMQVALLVDRPVLAVVCPALWVDQAEQMVPLVLVVN